MQNRLLAVVAFLSSAVVGCDDPEVQDKVESILLHGAVSAELKCAFVEDYGINYPTAITVSYTAYKFLDGSCMAELCQGPSYNYPVESAYAGMVCKTQFHPKGSGGETCMVYDHNSVTDTTISYPHRPFVDGVYTEVEDGLITTYMRDSWFTNPSSKCVNYTAGTCTDPFPQWSHDITDPDCTGRNLESFGATL